jgi:hypothetical protein
VNSNDTALPDLSHLIGRPDDLLDAVIDFLEGHRERWNQGEWISHDDDTVPVSAATVHCGTRGCVAGWGLLLTGHTLSPKANVLAGPIVAADKESDPNHFGTVYADFAAQRLLGLDEWEAGLLFDGNRREDANQIRRDVARIRAARGQS